MTKSNIKKIIIIIDIVLFLVMLFEIYLLFYKNKIDTDLYKKYNDNSRYSCANYICEGNDLVYNMSNSKYFERMDLKNKNIYFMVNNNYIFEADYKFDSDIIDIELNINNNSYTGNYDINKDFISLDIACDDCTVEEYNNIHGELRNDAYSIAIKHIMDILNRIKELRK